MSFLYTFTFDSQVILEETFTPTDELTDVKIDINVTGYNSYDNIITYTIESKAMGVTSEISKRLTLITLINPNNPNTFII